MIKVTSELLYDSSSDTQGFYLFSKTDQVLLFSTPCSTAYIRNVRLNSAFLTDMQYSRHFVEVVLRIGFKMLNYSGLHSSRKKVVVGILFLDLSRFLEY